jgi:uncharacterized protein YbcV (DUF1398 family)
MPTPIETLTAAQQHAAANRPRAGGFPYLAETLRQAGVVRNEWSLPACQSLYVMGTDAVVVQAEPLLEGMADVATFDEAALVSALRTDQEGESTFPEFLRAAWKAGVVGYTVDLTARRVIYLGALGEQYVEDYPAVSLAR